MRRKSESLAGEADLIMEVNITKGNFLNFKTGNVKKALMHLFIDSEIMG